MQPQRYTPTPLPELRVKRHNWNQFALILVFGLLAWCGIVTFRDFVDDEWNDTPPTATQPAGSPVIVVNAVLQLPTATPTPEPTSTFTPKPSNLDKYGSCDGRPGGSVCVNPTVTPTPGMMPILDGTPTRLPICDTVDENVLCIVPTPQGVTDNDLVLD